MASRVTLRDRIDRLKTVYFDNNFFNPRLTQLDPQSLAQHFISAGLQWCFSEELLLELFASIQNSDTKKLQMMRQWASFCFALWPDSRLFRNSSQIILEELKGKNPDIFVKEKDANHPIGRFFADLSVGRLPCDIASAWGKADEVKNKDEQFRLRLQGFRQKGAKELPLNQFSIIFLTKILAAESQQDINGNVNRIIFNLSMSPHLMVFLSIAHTLSYKRIGKGHQFDQRHLIYATDMDYFVTDDGPTATLANQIFRGRPSVLTQEEFLQVLDK